MKSKNNSHRLNGKDFMTIGMFTALYLVVYVVVACTFGLVPILSLFMQFFSSFILGIPMILYFAKIKKFGMVLITYIIIGVALLFLGTGVYTVFLAPICALIAEFILRSGNYEKLNLGILAFAITCVGGNANALYWVLASEESLAEHAASIGEEYVNVVLGYFSNWWMLPLILISAFVGGILGGFLGKKVLKKHFIRSGVL